MTSPPPSPLRRARGAPASSSRRFAVAVSTAAAPAAADTTTHTPVMGPSLLTANQLAAWYYAAQRTYPPRSRRSTGIPRATSPRSRRCSSTTASNEGVRGDIAFVQSQLETGWMHFIGSQIPPDAYNYAGIFAFDGRPGLPNCAHGDSSPSRCMGTPQHGVLVQIQLLRSYADPSAKTAPGRFISAPSDRAGRRAAVGVLRRQQLPVRQADLGVGDRTTASASSRCTRGALVESGIGRRVRSVRAAGRGPEVGHRLLGRHQDSVVHPFGDAQFFGDPRNVRLNAPLTGGESLSTRHGLLAARPRRRHLLLRRRATSTARPAAMRLNKPVNGMERTHATTAATGSSPTTAGSSRSANAHFYGSMGGSHLNQPVLGMERTASGNGLLALRVRRRHLQLRRRALLRFARRRAS